MFVNMQEGYYFRAMCYFSNEAIFFNENGRSYIRVHTRVHTVVLNSAKELSKEKDMCLTGMWF